MVWRRGASSDDVRHLSTGVAPTDTCWMIGTIHRYPNLGGCSMTNRIVSAIRRNLVAWLALFVALGGTGLATKRYLVTSPNQIKPSVLKQLKGRTGPTGPKGHAGSSGPKGEAGPKGEVGSKGETGLRGPGATTFATTIEPAAPEVTVAELGNGVIVRAFCSVGKAALLRLEASPGPHLQVSGTTGLDGTLSSLSEDNSFLAPFVAGKLVDIDVVARDSSMGGKFARLDAHATFLLPSGPCHVWGMVIPSG